MQDLENCGKTHNPGIRDPRTHHPRNRQSPETREPGVPRNSRSHKMGNTSEATIQESVRSDRSAGYSRLGKMGQRLGETTRVLRGLESGQNVEKVVRMSKKWEFLQKSSETGRTEPNRAFWVGNPRFWQNRGPDPRSGVQPGIRVSPGLAKPRTQDSGNPGNLPKPPGGESGSRQVSPNPGPRNPGIWGIRGIRQIWGPGLARSRQTRKVRKNTKKTRIP